MFAIGAGDRPLILGMREGEVGHEGIQTVGNWIAWNAGGGVGAEAARRPCPCPWLGTKSRERLREGDDETGSRNEKLSVSVSCSPRLFPFLFFLSLVRCGR